MCSVKVKSEFRFCTPHSVSPSNPHIQQNSANKNRPKRAKQISLALAAAALVASALTTATLALAAAFLAASALEPKSL